MMKSVRGGWTRRDVLRTAAAALPAWYLEEFPRRAVAQETSPNERFKIALVGCGGMGTGDAKNAQRFGDVVAVCDVDAGHRASGATHFGRWQSAKICVICGLTPEG